MSNSKPYLAAIDQGTTSSRCILFDGAGAIAAMAQREHRQIFPRPGWVEHDPEEIWSNVLHVVAAAMAKVSIGAADLAAVGIANQRETTVIWDKITGRPIQNAIVWQDTRTVSLLQDLQASQGQDRFRERCGLPLATYFSGPKARWLLQQSADTRRAAEDGRLLFGTIDSWLIWKLTGVHATDVSNASRTMLMNLETLEWDDELLAAMNIPRIMLPTIRSSAEIYGTANVEPLLGVPVAAALGDQQAALFGQTCFAPGEGKNTYGTGCFMLVNTGARPVRSRHGLLTTVAYKIGGAPAAYALEGSIAVTGALVQWLRDNLNLIATAQEIETLAESVADNGGCYVVPAFSGLFAPHWQADARGVIVGLTGYVTRAHIARAVLEATAWQTREVADAMAADSGLELSSLKVDGGMTANSLLMQFQADVLNVPVVRPVVAETSALGAAYAAGLAVRFWQDVEVLRTQWQKSAEWSPRMTAAERDRGLRKWKKAVQRSLAWMDADDQA